MEANAPPVRVERVETLPSVQPGTAIDELVAARVRADVAEKMLVVLQHQLAEMTAQRDRWEVALQARLTPGGVDSPADACVMVLPSSHANRGAEP